MHGTAFVRSTIACGLIALGFARAAAAQHHPLIVSIAGPPPDQIGRETDGNVDLDGDGVDDIASFATIQTPLAPWPLRIYSGRDGSLSKEILVVPPAGLSLKDRAIEIGPDVDGDGHPDIVVGHTSRLGSTSQYVGRVDAYSFATGALVMQTGPLVSADERVVSLSDVDGDGGEDVAFVSRFPTAAIGIVSGKRGALLSYTTYPFHLAYGGVGIDATGDLDGDTSSDFVVSLGGNPGGGVPVFAAERTR